MKKLFFTFVAMAVVATMGLVQLPETATAKKPQVFQNLVKGVAVGGYDPVAYFTNGKPVKGLKSITHKHQGAVWRFASTKNRDAFIANPAKYAPQYGGYCAWAVSQGYTAKGDPFAWKIHNGKLYLNYNKAVQATWSRDVPGNVRKGDKNWPRVLN